MSIGFWQVVLVLGIVLILFGAGKLPRVMGDLAKGIKSFKSGLKEDDPASDPDGQNHRLSWGTERAPNKDPGDRPGVHPDPR